MYDIFYISDKTIPKSDWIRFKDRFPRAQKIENVTSIEDVKKKAFTKFFWIVWNDLLIDLNFNFEYIVPQWDTEYIHVFKNGEHYDGVCLFPKHREISKKEFDARFYVNDKKEIDIIASVPKPYDKFYIDTFEEYLEAKEKSSTELFWFIPKEIDVLDTFDFNLQIDKRHVNEMNIAHSFQHIFRTERAYGGLSLIPRSKTYSEKEIKNRFFVEKKKYETVASTVKPYDIVFISYNEPNAEENFENLKSRFPNAKRIHGVKGIHNAHIEGAKLCETEMFWIVDGDAIILDDFNFSHEVSRYETDIVHVWRCKNPVNDLIYGYGGVKLFPRLMTINMDRSKPDMTTSISSKFKAMPALSNITAFNSDPFSTWRSAFRECAKLSSRIIDRQKEAETVARLDVWCTKGIDRLYGEYAIEGANLGREFGEKYKNDTGMLSKVNDFDWLREEYERRRS